MCAAPQDHDHHEGSNRSHLVAPIEYLLTPLRDVRGVLAAALGTTCLFKVFLYSGHDVFSFEEQGIFLDAMTPWRPALSSSLAFLCTQQSVIENRFKYVSLCRCLQTSITARFYPHGPIYDRKCSDFHIFCRTDSNISPLPLFST